MTAELTKLLREMGSSYPGKALASTNYASVGKDVLDHAKDSNELIKTAVDSNNTEQQIWGNQVKARIERFQKRALEDIPNLIKGAAEAKIKVDEAKEIRAARKENKLKIDENPDADLVINENKTTKDENSDNTFNAKDILYSVKPLDEYFADSNETLKNISAISYETKEVIKDKKAAFSVNRDLNEALGDKESASIANETDIAKKAEKQEIKSAVIQGSSTEILNAKNIHSAQKLQAHINAFVSKGGQGYSMVVHDVEGFPDGVSLERAIQEGRYDLIPAIRKSLANKFYTAAYRDTGIRLNPYQMDKVIIPGMNQLDLTLVTSALEQGAKFNQQLFEQKTADNISKLIDGQLENSSGDPISLLGTDKFNGTDGYLWLMMKAYPSAEGKHELDGALRAFVKNSIVGLDGGLNPFKMETFLNQKVLARDGSGKMISIRDIPWIKKTGYIKILDAAIDEAKSNEAKDLISLNRANTVNVSNAIVDRMMKELKPHERTEAALARITREELKNAQDLGYSIDPNNQYFTAKDFQTVEDIGDQVILTERLPPLLQGGKRNWSKIVREINRIKDVTLRNRTMDTYQKWFDDDAGDPSRIFNEQFEGLINENVTFQGQNNDIKITQMRALKQIWYGMAHKWAQDGGEYSGEYLLNAAADFKRLIENTADFSTIINGQKIYTTLKEKKKNETATLKLFSTNNQAALTAAVNSKILHPGEGEAIQAILVNDDYRSSFYDFIFEKSPHLKGANFQIPIVGNDGQPTGQFRPMNSVDFMIGRIAMIDEKTIEKLTGMNKREFLRNIVNHYKYNFTKDDKLNKILDKYPDINKDQSGLLAIADANSYQSILRVGNNTFNTIKLNKDVNPDNVTAKFPFYKSSKKASDYTIAEISLLNDSGFFSNIGLYNISPTMFKDILNELKGPDNPATPSNMQRVNGKLIDVGDESLVFEQGSKLKFTKEIQNEFILRAGIIRANNAASVSGSLSDWLRTRNINQKDINSVLKLFETQSWSKAKSNHPSNLVNGVSEIIFFTNYE